VSGFRRNRPPNCVANTAANRDVNISGSLSYASEMDARELQGVRVVVGGAGLAGLAAARDLEAAGAAVTVVEARDRVGGRVQTVRDDFAGGQHAEAGADLIEGEQSFVSALASDLGLKTVRILRDGFGYYGPDRSGRRRIRNRPTAMDAAARLLKKEVADYCLADKRWDSAIARGLARRSVAGWLAGVGADSALAAGIGGLRGFFLAEPEDLSLIALVDQFASGGTPGQGEIYRISGGNDRLARAIADALAGRLVLGAVLRRVHQTGTAPGVLITIDDRGTRRELEADFFVAAIPASTLRDVEFEPPLPAPQARAIAALKYGDATRTLLQFQRPFWRAPRRPRAFGTDLPTGAVWDGAEEQRVRPGILSLLAGGRASRALQDIIASEGAEGVVGRLAWLGKSTPLIAFRTVTWEDEPWSRGGYAVFDPSFDPGLRQWLARPAGRVVFAGEHTSLRWQGYMNGAIESGKRAAAEIRAIAQPT
jgi:monoamine oxidase